MIGEGIPAARGVSGVELGSSWMVKHEEGAGLLRKLPLLRIFFRLCPCLFSSPSSVLFVCFTVCFLSQNFRVHRICRIYVKAEIRTSCDTFYV